VQHDEYTLAGRKGGEKWHPRFTYHGFRYVQVDIRGEARLKSIRARFIHSAFDRVGTLETSNATFAALQSATERSYLSNFVGIPTDCPHREKNGWTGDAQLAMETGLWNFDAKDSYVHFLRMMLDAQRSNGAVPCILPCTPKFGFGWGSGPAWDAVLFEIPWQIYRFYGDDAPAREAYDAMKRYLGYISAQADGNGLYDYGLGDWANWYKDNPGTPVRLTDSAYVYQFNRRLAFWADRFGKKDFAAKCTAAAGRIKAAFNKAFYKGDGLYGEGRITELAAPLYFKGLCADGEEEKVARRLAEAVRAKNHCAHFGILGAKWAPRVLAEYGYADDAFKMFVQPKMPGWAHWLESGHGTLHEAWDDVSSLNHIMFGDLSAWGYEYAAGIVPLEPGFRKIAFRPHVLEGVDSFVVTHRTPFGEIRAGWRRVDGKVELVCEAPDSVEVEGRASDPSKWAYRNPSLPTEVRVKDLLSRMTIAEKCAQLGKLRGFNTYDRAGSGVVVRPDVAAGLAANCPGTVYGILRADWWSGRNWQTGVKPEMAVDAFNAYQRIAVERTRLGIPIFFVEEAPHGLMALGEPVYPTGLGLGSTFDADLMRRIGRQIGRARPRGVHCVYAPILDIARDPRWSRCEECFGEDPELVSVLGFAEFEGLRESGVEPCLKHYVGGGLAEGGHNTASAHFGLGELYNDQLRPFRRCISAGARHLMCTYHDVDGEPCTGSRFLLTDVLRGQLGFDGFVTADGGAIQLLNGRGIAASMSQAAALALKGGCDGESGSKAAAECGSVMRGAFDAGLVTMDDIDLAVGRILKLKFDMGLFERPYAEETSVDRETGRDLALEAARKSLVLLENRDALPLGRGLSVAVIGPNADDKIMNQLGDYTAPQRRADVVTVLDGVKAFASRVAYAKGCGIRSKRTDGFAEAERIASDADVTVLVLGGSSSPYAGVTQSDALGGATVVTGKEDDENDKDSGEGTDRSSLGYSGVQEELFRAVRAKAKKLVVVLIQGRPLVVDEIAAKADAVLLAWYPGAMGGQAVAEALYGEVNPSGRLPISIPHSVGQIPVHSGAYAANRPRYIDGPGDAAYPFGYGLSYTTFAYSGLEVSAADEASVSVTNTGKRDGDEIVRLYFSVKGSGRQRPHRELLAFRRVSIKAGETRRVTLPFDRRLFGEYGRDGAYEPPRGEVSIWVDGTGGTPRNARFTGLAAISTR